MTNEFKVGSEVFVETTSEYSYRKNVNRMVVTKETSKQIEVAYRNEPGALLAQSAYILNKETGKGRTLGYRSKSQVRLVTEADYQEHINGGKRNKIRHAERRIADAEEKIKKLQEEIAQELAGIQALQAEIGGAA